MIINPSKTILFLSIYLSSLHAFSNEVIKEPFKKTKLENFTESTCPSDKFDLFFKKFSEDLTLQRAYTYPIVTSTWIEVDQAPEPTPHVQTETKEKLSYPIVPNHEKRKEKNLILKYLDGDGSSVSLVSENNGYHVKYVFIRTSCWHLIAIQDFSI